MTDMCEAARRWWVWGYNIVPRKSVEEKRPAVRWKELQERRVTEYDLARWGSMFQDGGLGVITGEISRVVVVETDGPEGSAVLAEYEAKHGNLPETLTILSGSGRGLHYHFRHPGHRVKTSANAEIAVDIRGDGGFAVLPPSLHKSGERYKVDHPFDPRKLPALPPDLIPFIERKAAEARAAAKATKTAEARATVATKTSKGQAHSLVSLGLPAPTSAGLRSNLADPPPPFEEMAEMLKLLASQDVFADRDGVFKNEAERIVRVGWRETGMALKLAYGEEDGFELWAKTHIDDRAVNDAPTQWASFSSEYRRGDVTIGTIIRAACDVGYKSPQSIARIEAEDDGDLMNARIFAEMYRERLLHIHETGGWLSFRSETGWVTAEPGEAERAARAVVARLGQGVSKAYGEAGPGDDGGIKRMMAHVKRSSDKRQISAMIDLAKSEPGMTVRLSDFDVDPMMLGVRNGVLNLNTGKLLALLPTIRVSKRCGVTYDPAVQCPDFLEFLGRVQPDPEMRRFLQRLAGLCLTGRVGEQKFWFLYGLGANGKSVFVETLAFVLGDYSAKIQTEMLMQHRRDPQAASPDIVMLKGRRFVYANETSDGARLCEDRIKDMTGGDRLTGRVLYGLPVTFEPTHKLIGNHRPVIADASFSMWRRVCLTPFETTIPEGQRDNQLMAKLRREGSGILNWALEGLRDYLGNGLQIPAKVSAATDEYREEQDTFGEWIVENCRVGAGLSAPKTDLYDDYKRHAERNGRHPLTSNSVSRKLKERGVERGADKRTMHGIALKAPGLMSTGGTPPNL